MTLFMDLGSICTQMEDYTREMCRKGGNKEEGRCIIPTEISTLENGKKIRSMGLGPINISAQGRNMKASGKTNRNQDMEPIFMRMEIDMKENGNTTRKKAAGSYFMLMEVS